MPKLKPDHISPTDEEDAIIHAAALADPDNPPLDEAFWRNARPAREVLPPAVYAALTDKSKPPVIRIVTDEEDRARNRGGRPKLDAPKVLTTIRLDADVLAWFRTQVAGGGNYQSLMNSALRAHIDEQEGALERTLRRVLRAELRQVA